MERGISSRMLEKGGLSMTQAELAQFRKPHNDCLRVEVSLVIQKSEMQSQNRGV